MDLCIKSLFRNTYPEFYKGRVFRLGLLLRRKFRLQNIRMQKNQLKVRRLPVAVWIWLSKSLHQRHP